MRKLKRILSLFLVSILVVGNVQAIPAEASNITKLEIKVKGEGEVIIDDGSSKYSLGNKDVFRADCTVDTNLRITATPNEGYFISSIDGIENDGVINGNSKIYDVNLKENANSIIINFTEKPKEEIKDEYEKNTGSVIIETLTERNIDELSVPGIIIASHGPFAWGETASKAVLNAVVLEEVAKMAIRTENLNKDITSIPSELQDKHYFRKHGANAYYGQSKVKVKEPITR